MALRTKILVVARETNQRREIASYLQSRGFIVEAREYLESSLEADVTVFAVPRVMPQECQILERWSEQGSPTAVVYALPPRAAMPDIELPKVALPENASNTEIKAAIDRAVLARIDFAMSRSQKKPKAAKPAGTSSAQPNRVLRRKRKPTPAVASPPPLARPEQFKNHSEPSVLAANAKKSTLAIDAAAHDLQGRVPTFGRLDRWPVSRLLAVIFGNQASGRLRLEEEERTRTVYFDKGEPIYAESSVKEELLGETLVRMGFLSSGQLKRSLARQYANESIGECLIRQTELSSEQLMEALDHQVFERIVACFSASEGSFRFEEGSWQDRVQSFRQNPIELIYDGLKRHLPPNDLGAKMGAVAQSYVVRTVRFRSFQPFLPEEASQSGIFELIDGSRTVTDLTTQATKSNVMETLRILWTLREADMVAFRQEPDDGFLNTQRSEPPSRPVRHRVEIRAARPPRPSEAELAIVKLYGRMGGDPSELIGVPHSASFAELRTAFNARMDEIHQDKVRSLPPGIQDKADEVRRALKRAYESLANHHRKKSARDSRALPSRSVLTTGPTSRAQRKPAPPRASAAVRIPRPAPSRAKIPRPDAPPPKSRIPRKVSPAAPAVKLGGVLRNKPDDDIDENSYEALLGRAQRAVEIKAWRTAYTQIKRALEINAHDAEAVTVQAWVVFNLGKQKDAQRAARLCKERLELAISISPRMIEPYYYLGLVWEEEDPVTAHDYFEAVLKLNPEYKDAERRVQALKNKLPADSDDGKMLNKLKGWFG